MGLKKEKPRLPEKNAKLVGHFEVKNEKQQELINLIKKKEIVIASGPAGTGKAQPLYSKVYTPNGPIKMGDVYIGLEVSTPDGNTAKITNIYPQGIKDCYRVYFTDNTFVDCCAEHLWKVYTDCDREYNRDNNSDRFSILQTKDMIGSVLIRGNRKNYKMPITNPVYYTKQNLAIDPYVLGVLIGDGGMTSGNTILTSKDDEIISFVNEIIKKDCLFLKPTKATLEKMSYDYVVAIKDKEVTRENKITRETGKLGLRCKSEYKFIPEVYLYSSIEDRISLLQGLMDTDGTIDKRNGCPSYNTSSKKLSEDFCELVRSLGGIATVSLKKTKCLNAYVININLPNNILPFRLTRKLNYVIPKSKYLTPRFITNIEYIGQVEQQCIEVDSKEHLYITDNHIVTHNTYVALATALSMLGEVYKRIILVKSVTTIPGEEIGFLKGSMEQKMEPFVMSYMWNIDKICGMNSSQELLNKGLLDVLPLAYIRGLSIDDSIVIIDESQNLDPHTFKSIITRIGDNSKYIFLGDTEQVDRRKKNESCLQQVLDIFEGDKLIGTLQFTDEDCVRNPIIPKILNKLRENGI